MVVEILGTVHQLLFWLSNLENEFRVTVDCISPTITLVAQIVGSCEREVKAGHQRYKFPSFDSSNGLQTTGCGESPATTTRSLMCKRKKEKKHKERLHMKRCTRGNKQPSFKFQELIIMVPFKSKKRYDSHAFIHSHTLLIHIKRKLYINRHLFELAVPTTAKKEREITELRGCLC